jgi:cellulose synthase/poly-beta-1,6-N-acetylglucosamine synthase-like glycosyltransferase
MVIALLIQLLAGVSVVFAAALCLYCVGLALAAPRTRRTKVAAGAPRHSFAIVIPAHDEEAHIADVLNACTELDYPHEKYRVFVVADNCRDRTAPVAAAHGAIVLERHDEARRGKGAALEWSLGQVLAEPVDAVIILDADCRLEATALRTFDRHLRNGDQVLQASYVAANPDESIVSYVGSVANCIENDLFYAPKARLGLAVLLRGTGMVFHRKVLEECPWRADSIVEDVEYTIRLARAGIPVCFVPEAVVGSAFPAHQQQLAVQRTRWVGGNFELALRHTLPLLWEGIRLGRPVLFDLAWTLFASMRSLVLLQLFVSVLLAGLAACAAPRSVSAALLEAALALVVLYGLYFGAGVLRLGLTRQRMLLLLSAPGTVFRLLLIAAGSILPGRARSWERTPR